MRAFIKEDKWVNFVATAIGRGFFPDTLPNGERMYVRNPDGSDSIGFTMLLITMDRELHLATPVGESPFMEAHKETFSDLIADDFIEYVEGDFD